METEKTLRLLMLDDSVNDIELLVSHLRNCGLAVHALNADTKDAFDELLLAQGFDMILCALNAVEPALDEVVQEIKKAEKDIPLIALDAQYHGESATEVMTLGARDYVTKQNLDHLALVIKREYLDLQLRRKMRLQDKSVREVERRCHTLLDSSRDAITYVHEGMHIYANQIYLDMFGFTSAEDIDGMPILDMVAAAEHATFKDFLKRYGKGAQSTETLNVKGVKQDGSTFSASMEFSPASIDSEPCTQIIIRAQTNDKELEDKLKFLSKQDLLTGLYNRQYFLEELEQALEHAVSGEQSRAVLYIEPDNLKQIKETAGIAGTDLILSDIANVLKQQVNETDGLLSRFSDYSFTILLNFDDQVRIQTICENICAAMAEHIVDVNGKSMTFTVSIGVSIVGETAISAQDILNKADLSCEMMHKQGGNRVHLHNPVADLKAGRDRDQQLNQLLHDALEKNRFTLAYQPIASLQGDATERYEVLLRLLDADGTPIPPGSFIPVAEQSDLIVKIDRWVIANAIRVLSERRTNGYNTILFVKISGRTLTDETILPWISAQLKKARLGGDAVVFELSEPVAVNHLKFAKVFSQGLQQLHCGFCLEDFGNGANSFQLLKHLHTSYLKLDGAFMHNFTDNKENQAMVKSVVDMASALGKPVIAEFVEDAGALSRLWQIGVHFIQGNFLQKPDGHMTFDFSPEDDAEQRSF